MAARRGTCNAVGAHHISPPQPPRITRMATKTVTVSPGESSSSASAAADAGAAAAWCGLGQPLCMNVQSHARVWWPSSQERVAGFHTHGRYTLSCEKKDASHRAALSYCVAHIRLKMLIRPTRSSQVSFLFSDGSSRRSQRQSGFDAAFAHNGHVQR